MAPKGYNTGFSKKRRQKIAELKLESGCVDCGYKKCSAALQFHHVRGEKEFNITTNVTLAWDRIVAEIAKCDVVCANCHAERHWFVQ